MLTTIECRAATTEFGGCLWHNNHTGTRVAWCRSCGQCRTTTTVFLVGLFRRSYTETWRAFRTCSALAAGERKCTGDRAVVRWQTHCRDVVLRCYRPRILCPAGSECRVARELHQSKCLPSNNRHFASTAFLSPRSPLLCEKARIQFHREQFAALCRFQGASGSRYTNLDNHGSRIRLPVND